MKVYYIANINDAMEKNDFVRAERLCLNSLKMHPKNPWLLSRLSSSLYQQGRHKQALQVSKKAFMLAPTHPLIIWDYANSLASNGKHNEAINIYKRIIKQKIRYIAVTSGKDTKWARSLKNDCRYAISLCYSRINDYREAIQWMQKHLKNRSISTPSLWEENKVKKKHKELLHKASIKKRAKLIEIYYEQEKWSKAKHLLLQVLRESPGDIWFLAILSSIYYEEKNYKKAYTTIKKAMKLEPEEPLVMWHYTGSLDSLNRPKDAIQVYKKIINKGVNKIAFIDTTEGIRWARSLINDCMYRIGLCYKDVGNPKQAKIWLKKHIENRRPGIPSIYTLREVKKELSELY